MEHLPGTKLVAGWFDVDSALSHHPLRLGCEPDDKNKAQRRSVSGRSFQFGSGAGKSARHGTIWSWRRWVGALGGEPELGMVETPAAALRFARSQCQATQAQAAAGARGAVRQQVISKADPGSQLSRLLSPVN